MVWFNLPWSSLGAQSENFGGEREKWFWRRLAKPIPREEWTYWATEELEEVLEFMIAHLGVFHTNFQVRVTWRARDPVTLGTSNESPMLFFDHAI